MKKTFLLKTVAALVLVSASSAFATSLGSSATDVLVTATVQESLTISLDQTAVTFALTPGAATNAANTAINVTTTWNLASGRTAVQLYAYVDSPSSALANGTNYIPSSDLSASVGGTSVGAFTSTVPFGTGVTLFDQAITTNLSGTNNSAVTLNINLSSLPTLAAGAYTGTIHFQAQATP